ncbi:hypothetical protein [Symmachiella dynata]|uniref:hypothetical protein n=1 Tax=Symmachiella dynata TaxID=2527995 RepID=UPI0030EE1590
MKQIILACFTSLGLISSAQAEMISFSDTQTVTDSFTFQGVGTATLSVDDLDLTLQQFNPTLGTLQSVNILYEVLSSNATIKTTNKSITEIAVITGNDAESDGEPGFPGIPTGDSSSGGGFSTGLAPDASYTVIDGLSGGYNEFANLSSSPNYIGTGNVVSSNVIFTFSRSIDTISGLNNLNDLLTEGSMSATVKATVIYTYDTTVVPEPSTYAGLLGITCVSLLVCGWRHIRQQAV